MSANEKSSLYGAIAMITNKWSSKRANSWVAKARLSMIVKADRLNDGIVNLNDKLNALNNANVDKSGRMVALFGASFI